MCYHHHLRDQWPLWGQDACVDDDDAPRHLLLMMHCRRWMMMMTGGTSPDAYWHRTCDRVDTARSIRQRN